MKANYVKVGSQAWAARISAAMNYYSRRPGDDLDHDLETPAAERQYHSVRHDEPHVIGRDFYTASGEKIPLAEAEDRFFAQVEARRAEHQRQRDADRAARKTARDAAFDEKCRRFLAGEDRRPGRRQLSPERRQVLVDRWRQTRQAQEKLPDPVFRIYRVVLSTERAVMEGRDLREVLETAVAGTAGAVAGAIGHAAKTAYRNAQRDHARWSKAHEWMYVRHDTGSHPHVHALLVTEGRGLYTRDLDRMRDTLEEREAVREHEMDRARQRGQQRDDRGRER